jgi:hypothetical protein
MVTPFDLLLDDGGKLALAIMDYNRGLVADLRVGLTVNVDDGYGDTGQVDGGAVDVANEEGDIGYMNDLSVDWKQWSGFGMRGKLGTCRTPCLLA